MSNDFPFDNKILEDYGIDVELGKGKIKYV